MIYTKSHFSWFLLNMRNFLFLFFKKLSWSGYWRRHAERFQHWLTVVRDIFSPHLSQGRPENTHTAFKHQETSKHYHLVLSNKVQNYLLLFSFHSERHLPYTNLLQVTQFWESKMDFESIQLLFFCKIGFKKSGNFQNVLKFLT